MASKIILASSSSARLKLLQQININPEKVIAPQIDETPKKKEKIADFVKRMAFEKAKKIYEENKDYFVIGADSSAYHNHRIIHKTDNENEAEKNIISLNGKNHRMYSAVCVFSPNGKYAVKLSISKIKLKRLTNKEIKQYLESKYWKGKAGGYGLEGESAWMIKEIHGSYTSIIGLDLYETRNLLVGLGCKFTS